MNNIELNISGSRNFLISISCWWRIARKAQIIIDECANEIYKIANWDKWNGVFCSMFQFQLPMFATEHNLHYNDIFFVAAEHDRYWPVDVLLALMPIFSLAEFIDGIVMKFERLASARSPE